MIAFKIPPCCKECINMVEYHGLLGSKFYCHTKAIDPTNQQQDISTVFVDPEARPDWCPIASAMDSMRKLEPRKRNAVQMLLRSMSTLFDSEDLLEETEDG